MEPDPNAIYPNENIRLFVCYLLDLKWWNWDADKIFRNMDALCSGDLNRIRSIAD